MKAIAILLIVCFPAVVFAQHKSIHLNPKDLAPQELWCYDKDAMASLATKIVMCKDTQLDLGAAQKTNDQLKENTPVKPFYKEWWFGAGVAFVCGGVAGYVLHHHLEN